MKIIHVEERVHAFLIGYENHFYRPWCRCEVVGVGVHFLGSGDESRKPGGQADEGLQDPVASQRGGVYTKRSMTTTKGACAYANDANAYSNAMCMLSSSYLGGRGALSLWRALKAEFSKKALQYAIPFVMEQIWGLVNSSVFVRKM